MILVSINGEEIRLMKKQLLNASNWIGIFYFIVTLFAALPTICFADCNCSDWISKGGYCVAYVRSRINSLPSPQGAAAINIPSNKDIKDVEEGDAAIFAVGKYGHVAYVEKVNRDNNGKAVSINVSEMNYGKNYTLDEFVKRWNPDKKNAKSELDRAVCCGVTSLYMVQKPRTSIPIKSIDHIWSPNHNSNAKQSQPHNSNNYQIRISNIDDFGECKVNGHEVASANYYEDTGWKDISSKLHSGENEIEFKVKNRNEGFTYYFGFMENNHIKWEKSCGKVGSKGCDEHLSKDKTLTKKIKVKI